MSAPAGTGLEQHYKPIDETYHTRGEYKGGYFMPPAHKNAGLETSGSVFDPHQSVVQNVIEYEADGITVKRTTVLDAKGLAALAAANAATLTPNEPQGPKNTITYKYAQPKKTMGYAEAAAVGATAPAPAPQQIPEPAAAPAPTTTGAAPELEDVPPPAMPRFRTASETPMPPSLVQGLATYPERATPMQEPEAPKRALTQVQISTGMGRCNVKCLDIFIQDMFLVMVQHEDISGVFEAVMDPETDIEVMFGGKRHLCRTICHYKMPDGKTAHSVYVLIGVEG